MRQFIVEKGKEKNGLIQLDGKDYRYLRQVLRVRAGDMISVRLPDGLQPRGSCHGKSDTFLPPLSGQCR